MFESYKTRGKVAEVQTTLFFVRRGIGGISQVTSVDHCLNYSNYSLLNLTVSCTQISLSERPGINYKWETSI